MDISRLIAIVQEYEELYNLKHSHYSNQQRRDNIWGEIGKRLNETGNACRERWTRIRDNHRKALNLRKTKSGQAASKLKPPKYHMELSFLTPYLNDDEERRSNLSPIEIDLDEVDRDTPNNVDQPDINSASSECDIQDLPSPSQTVSKKSKITAFQGPSAANVLKEYLEKKEAMQNRNQSDPLIDFFINMAKTVKTFPLQDQVQIKAQLFQMVNGVEMRLALDSQKPTLPLPPTSNAMFLRPHISQEMLSPPSTSNKSASPAMNETQSMLSPSPNPSLLYLP